MIAQIDAWLIIGYVILCVIIGWLSSRKQSAEDYMTHGRSIGLFAFVATIAAGYIGGGAIVAYVAYVYQFGVVATVFYIALFFGFLYLAWHGPRLWKEARKYNYHTLPDFFYHHFGKKAGLAISIVLLLTVFMSILDQFIAGSSILSEISGWSYEVGLLVTGGVILVYLLLGGFRSVVKTDMFQYVVMLVLFLVLGIATVGKTGVDPSLLSLSTMSPALLMAFVLYGFVNPIGLGDIWQRIYAAKSASVVRKGLIIGGFFAFLMGSAIGLVGLAARTAFPGLDPARATAYGFVNLLPPGVLGFGLLVLFAAIMSSTDSAIFYMATSIAKDFFGQLGGRKNSNELRVNTRTSVVIITLLGVVGAYFFRDIISVILTLAGIAVSIIPTIVFGFHVKLKENAIIVSIVASFVYVGMLMVLGVLSPELVMGSLLVSLVFLLVGQLVFKQTAVTT